MDYIDFARMRRLFGSTSPEMTRRTILQNTLAAGMQTLLSCSGASVQMGSHAKRRVVIIGAGLAGLACGHELSSIGYEVTVVEARDRLGGRVHSLRDLVKERVIEAGGEFIGANHPLWIAYARKFNLALSKGHSEEEHAPPAMVVEGQKLSGKQARRLYQEMDRAFAVMTQAARAIVEASPWESLHAQLLDQQSIAGWIEGLTVSRQGKQALRAYFTGLNGVEPEQQSYLAMLTVVKGGGLERYWTDSEIFRCRGGNQQLATQLAKTIQKVHIKRPVQGIQIHPDRGVVTCADGSILEADDIVLAVPPSVWNRLIFSPTLPTALQPQMGANVKYLACVRRRFWQDHKQSTEVSSDHILHSVWEGTAVYTEEKNAVLTAFSGGREAMDAHHLSRVERENVYQKQLELFFPGFQSNFLSGRFVDWIADPWSQGSYSFPAPGQVMTQGPMLNKAYQQRLHFAGEHTCLKFVGYMEGALQSGVAVAKRIAARDRIS